jgi:type I restriction enzyme M protein
VLDQIVALEASLEPYEQIKRNLAAARDRFRKLTDAFISELKNRCGFMGDDKKSALVLELLRHDVQGGLDAAVSEKRQGLVRFVEGLWDKYRESLRKLEGNRSCVASQLTSVLKGLGYEHD